MMAVRTDRAIVYHIPKCGGTWVKVAMEAAGLAYKPTRNIIRPHPFNLKKAHATPDEICPRYRAGKFSITFVRRPVAWYTSYWSFRSRKGARRDEKFPADGLWSDDFDRFVNNLLDAYPGGFVTTLYQYYTGKDREKIDFVGRQEHLADDLVDALTMAGEDFDEAALRATPRRNQSPDKWKEKCIVSDATLARVNEAEGWIERMFYG